MGEDFSSPKNLRLRGFAWEKTVRLPEGRERFTRRREEIKCPLKQR